MITSESLNSFLFSLFGFVKVKSKVHIALIVLVHTFGWSLFFFLPLLLYPFRITESRVITSELIGKSALVGLFYLNYYFFIPVFFERKKYFVYGMYVLLAFIIYFGINIVTRTGAFKHPSGNFQLIQFQPKFTGERKEFAFQGNFFRGIDGERELLFGIDSGKYPQVFRIPLNNPDSVERLSLSFPLREPVFFGIPRGAWIVTLNNAISSFVLMLLIGGFIRLAFSFIRNQNEIKVLENAKLNTEVNFLKSQINPHFLFNTLNGIYSQAHERSENTEYSVLKLSELLRYMLYDSGETEVDLEKDISYINNYIDLQRMRLSSKVKINYALKGNLQKKKIAPLLLIPFIENAFKYGVSYRYPSTIQIEIQIFEKTLTMLVSNPMAEKNNFIPGGLGLKNVKRRLELLYPGKYMLDIYHDNYVHVVNLKLKLNSD